MEKLQNKTTAEQALFNKQSEHLQRIESQIASEETASLLHVISLREQAAIFRLTEAEKERQRVAELKAARKREFMQHIQDNIAEN